MPTYTDDLAALDAIVTQLKTVTDGTFDVLKLEDEPTEPETAGKAYVRCEIETGNHSPEWSAADDSIRTLSILLTATGNDFNGGRVGDANPHAIQNIIAQVIANEFREHHDTWGELGFYAVQDVTLRGTTEEPQQGIPLYRRPTRLTCFYEQS